MRSQLYISLEQDDQQVIVHGSLVLFERLLRMVGEGKNLRAALDPDQSHVRVAEQDEGLGASEGQRVVEAAREQAET